MVSTASALESPTIMKTYGEIAPIRGAQQFCESFPEECVAEPGPRITLTVQKLAELDDVNQQGAKLIAGLTDLEIYGEIDVWSFPVVREIKGKRVLVGDCEDSVIWKRHRLIRLGWPARSLLITIVFDENGAGHAVLVAATAEGDYVLDNRRKEIRLMRDTGYSVIMRQSVTDPRVWVSLVPQLTDEIKRWLFGG